MAMILSFRKRVWQSLISMLTVIVYPRRTFDCLTSLSPFLLVWIAGGTFKDLRLLGLYNRIGVDTLTRHSVAKMPEMKFSAAQISNLTNSSAELFPLQMVSTPLMWIVGLIITATLLLEIDRHLFKSTRSFRQVLSIITYAQMPSIIFTIVTCILLWSHPSPSNLRIDALLGTNPGLLIPPGSVPLFYRAILDSLDVWAIWSVLLVGMGLSSERTRIGKALSYVGALWLLWIVTVAGFSTLGTHIAMTAMNK